MRGKKVALTDLIIEGTTTKYTSISKQLEETDSSRICDAKGFDNSPTNAVLKCLAGTANGVGAGEWDILTPCARMLIQYFHQ